MNRKRKYRRFVLWCLGIDLLAIGWSGWRYLDRKIPDELHVAQGRSQDVRELLDHPLLGFGDTITVSQEGSYRIPCRLFGLIPFKEIKVTPAKSSNVLVSGSSVGIYMETQGVLIIDTGEILSQSGTAQEPAKNLVKPGDYIVAFNDQEISTKKELMDDLKTLDGEEVVLDIKRGEETIPVSVTPVKDTQGEYKLGIWVRDDTQGIGTLTFVDSEGRYGALGHGISDVDTGELLSIKDGALYQAQILGIQKGSDGYPGELSGLIHYDSSNIIGSISLNTKNGIYGTFNGNIGENIELRQMPVGYKQEITTGPAGVLCSIDGKVEEYTAEITRIDMNHEDTNKSFVIHITDQRLLEATGGIVQGMSGTPVVQNGKFIGAITHVFVQDSTSGYGIFAETMLEGLGR
ncbi:MAG TPA: SpoIVB peptidase [Candidatus Blautia faecigallinarum]|uniref:SpoIVB peptidase n=1 Tax=Candidatus Blautia faecigallinarum TaxID=2838488 RepID=A0A9D2ITA6_9FIRM|nr:SpoIVB peptidase [Candidatus Blautia faecigallinarum]